MQVLYMFHSIFTSDNQVSCNGAAVHLGLYGTRVLPSMPQLNVSDHDVTCRVLLKKKDQRYGKELQIG